jgi:hypothetical protein
MTQNRQRALGHRFVTLAASQAPLPKAQLDQAAIIKPRSRALMQRSGALMPGRSPLVL